MSKHRTKSAPAAGGAGVKGSKSKKPLAVEFESKEKSDGGGPVIPEKEESVKSKSFIYEAPPLPLHPPVTPPDEPEDDTFREYLENVGVIRTLSKYIIALYEADDRPENPVQGFLAKLAEGLPVTVELIDDAHRSDLDKQLAELEIEKLALIQRLEKYNPLFFSNPDIEDEEEYTETEEESEFQTETEAE